MFTLIQPSFQKTPSSQTSPRRLSNNEMNVSNTRLSRERSPSRTPQREKSTPAKGRKKRAATTSEGNRRESVPRVDNALEDIPQSIQVGNTDPQVSKVALNGFYTLCARIPKKGKVTKHTKTARRKQLEQHNRIHVYMHNTSAAIIFYKDGRWRLNDISATDGWLYSNDSLVGPWEETADAQDFSGIYGTPYPVISIAHDLAKTHSDKLSVLHNAYTKTASNLGTEEVDVTSILHMVRQEQLQHIFWAMLEGGGAPVNWGVLLQERLCVVEEEGANSEEGVEGMEWGALRAACLECLAAATMQVPSPLHEAESSMNTIATEAAGSNAVPETIEDATQASPSPTQEDAPDPKEVEIERIKAEMALMKKADELEKECRTTLETLLKDKEAALLKMETEFLKSKERIRQRLDDRKRREEEALRKREAEEQVRKREKEKKQMEKDLKDAQRAKEQAERDAAQLRARDKQRQEEEARERHSPSASPPDQGTPLGQSGRKGSRSGTGSPPGQGQTPANVPDIQETVRSKKKKNQQTGDDDSGCCTVM